MKISYNWLKNYIDLKENPEEIAAFLTQIGLEVSNIEEYCSIEGGLKNFVIGEVLTCEKHPDADRLSVTNVKVSETEVLQIVCGAPNVAAGQKVVVALNGAIVKKGNEAFTIKKSKIRGVESNGMICAEDEIGLGNSHDGILIIAEDAKVGMNASEYFKIENDYVFEIDITPNRIDAASHIGVARDLAAFFDRKVSLPEVQYINTCGSKNDFFEIEIQNHNACKRYSGIFLNNVKIQDSPQWLKNRLKSIGLNPINNVVDVTNYVLHETGQPLHAFDADKIKGNKIIVKTVPENTKFLTLDGIERKLSADDLMICNIQEPMCIAGVFGGLHSGISDETKNIFIESAWFNPSYIRKTARRHQLSTDSSFRFERGADVNLTIYAALRAAEILENIGAAKISSEIFDLYPNKIENAKVNFDYNKARKFIGKNIDNSTLNKIIKLLDIKILENDDFTAVLEIPSYRIDVTRMEDVIEEILRIYGYNNIEIPTKISLSINKTPKPDNEYLTNEISDFLAAAGFNEIMCNSLIKSDYIDEKLKNVVRLHNPLSNDLSVLRHHAVFGGLETITFNVNRKNPDLKLFEFGRTYHINDQINDIEDINRYFEKKYLALWITGKENYLTWNKKDTEVDYFYLKAYVNLILKKAGINSDFLETQTIADDIFSYSLIYYYKNNKIVQFGEISKEILHKTDTDQKVFHAVFEWENLVNIISENKIQFSQISKFPKVKRDLSIMIDKNISYETLKIKAYELLRRNLVEVRLFDVYEGKGIEPGKISYALSFIFEDKEKTMTDKQIDNFMNTLIKAYKDMGAQIR